MGPHNHMKHQQRQRGRGRKPGGGNHSGGGGGGHSSGRNFESNGPDMKVRGSASTIYEKYLQLARDANSSGDRVMAESYLQHAEHYYRVLRASQPAHQPAPVEHRYERFGHDPDLDDDENNEEFEAGADQAARENGDQPDMEAREGRPPQPQYRDDRGPRNDNRNDHRNDGPREPRAEGDDEFRRGRRNRRNRFRPDGERGPRLEGESNEAYDAREPRDVREPREERAPREDVVAREPREERAPREPREPRAEGDERPPRRERAPRREQAEAPEGFADSPKPAFLAGD